MPKKKAEKTKVMTRAERAQKIIESTRKKTGAGEAIRTFRGERENKKLERFSSGCISIDNALGGGWPKARQHDCQAPAFQQRQYNFFF